MNQLKMSRENMLHSCSNVKIIVKHCCYSDGLETCEHHCSEHGHCVKVHASTYKCQCHHGWEGTDCSHEIIGKYVNFTAAVSIIAANNRNPIHNFIVFACFFLFPLSNGSLMFNASCCLFCSQDIILVTTIVEDIFKRLLVYFKIF
jgi:hypothetical protein